MHCLKYHHLTIASQKHLNHWLRRRNGWRGSFPSAKTFSQIRGQQIWSSTFVSCLKVSVTLKNIFEQTVHFICSIFYVQVARGTIPSLTFMFGRRLESRRNFQGRCTRLPWTCFWRFCFAIIVLISAKGNFFWWTLHASVELISSEGTQWKLASKTFEKFENFCVWIALWFWCFLIKNK